MTRKNSGWTETGKPNSRNCIDILPRGAAESLVGIESVDVRIGTAPEPSKTNDPLPSRVFPTASLGRLTRANCSRTRNRAMEFPVRSTVTRLAPSFKL